MSFVYSEQHSWQGEEAVQQILVFNNEKAKEIFEDIKSSSEIEYQTQTCQLLIDADMGARTIIIDDKLLQQYTEQFNKQFDDNNCGACFKLRAVKDGEGTWAAMVRCGITGELLAESTKRHPDAIQALHGAKETLKDYLRDIADEELLNG